MLVSLGVVATLLGVVGGRACGFTLGDPSRDLSRDSRDLDGPVAVDPMAPLTPPIERPREQPTLAEEIALAPLPSAALAEKKAGAQPSRPDPPVREPRQPRNVEAGARTALVDDAADAGVPSQPPATTPTTTATTTTASFASAADQPPALPSAPLVVTYRDELSWLKLVQMRVFVDGKRVIDDSPTDANRPPRGERTLLSTRVFPGHHQVRIEASYVGESSGIFNYMEAVKVRMREMTVLEVDPSKGARVIAHAFDRGALEPWEKRPGLKFTVE